MCIHTTHGDAKPLENLMPEIGRNRDFDCQAFKTFLQEQMANDSGGVASKQAVRKMFDNVDAAQQIHTAALSLIEWAANHEFCAASILQAEQRDNLEFLLADGENVW